MLVVVVRKSGPINYDYPVENLFSIYLHLIANLHIGMDKRAVIVLKIHLVLMAKTIETDFVNLFVGCWKNQPAEH